MAARRIPVLLLLPWLGLAPWPLALGGVAAEPPLCTPAVSGSVACIAGRLCRCGLQLGGSTTDLAAGHRWDCGVLRPYCDRPSAAGRAGESAIDFDLIVPVPPDLVPGRRHEHGPDRTIRNRPRAK